MACDTQAKAKVMLRNLILLIQRARILWPRTFRRGACDSQNVIHFYPFGWGGLGLMDLDLRAQIQILCLDDLKPLGFGFGPNPWISNDFLR